MNRREAIGRVAMIFGGAIVGANLFLEGCTRPANTMVEVLFDPQNINLLSELAEAILPETSTPGAKQAEVGSFIPVMVRDCYSLANQTAFVTGLQQVDVSAKKEFGKSFLELYPEQKFEFVIIQDKLAKEFQNERKEQVKLQEQQIKDAEKGNTDAFQVKQKIDQMKEDYPNHFFTLLKQLTLTGYFTSEVGMNKGLRYVKIPGRFDGEFPYQKGDRAWAL
jgi:hypothetical protein